MVNVIISSIWLMVTVVMVHNEEISFRIRLQNTAEQIYLMVIVIYNKRNIIWWLIIMSIYQLQSLSSD